MKLKIKMKMKTNKKKGGSFFFPPLVQLSQNTGGRAASPSCNYQWRQKNNKQTTEEEEEQKTELFCGPESTRALTNKLLKTLLSRTGNGKGKKFRQMFSHKEVVRKAKHVKARKT